MSGTKAIQLVGTGGGLSFSGAMVKKSGNQTGANYSAGAVIAWDAESYDVGGWHDNSTNNSRLTVPSGVAYVQVGGSALLGSVTLSVFIEVAVLKNGTSSFDGAVDIDFASPVASPGVGWSSGAIAVIAGDYFEFYLATSDTSIDITAARSNFWIRALG